MSFGSWEANSDKKALTSVAAPLARNNLPGSFSNVASHGINKFESKISRKGAVREDKGFIYFEWRYEWYY